MSVLWIIFLLSILTFVLVFLHQISFEDFEDSMIHALVFTGLMSFVLVVGLLIADLRLPRLKAQVPPSRVGMGFLND